MDKIQTPDVRHEEAWWQNVLIAYAQLYLARSWRTVFQIRGKYTCAHLVNVAQIIWIRLLIMIVRARSRARARIRSVFCPKSKFNVIEDFLI